MTLNDTGEVILKCSKPHIPCDGRNTAYKAAQYYFDATGVPFGADIYIEKHIPDQAGMGGGSADAAAVLKLLNHLCAEAGESRSNTAELLYLGLRIGADVPFCILNGTYRWPWHWRAVAAAGRDTEVLPCRCEAGRGREHAGSVPCVR